MAYSFIHSVSCYRSESAEILNLLRVLSSCGSLRDNTHVYVLSRLHSLRFAFTHSPQMSELIFPLHKHSKQVVHIHCIKMFWFVLVRSLRNKHATIQTCPVPFHLGYHCLSLIWSLYYYTELHDAMSVNVSTVEDVKADTLQLWKRHLVYLICNMTGIQ